MLGVTCVREVIDARPARPLPGGSLKADGSGWRDGRPVESDVDLVWPEERVASAVFPEGALTCEWGHRGSDEYREVAECSDCGLLRGEDYYKKMGSAVQ